MTIRMDEGAAELLDTLHRAGYAAYVVGGCVRDSLLGLTPHDWDLCTSALPQQVMELFGAQRCIPTGLQHGTVTVKQSGALYEITTFRTEGTYTDGRHPDEVHFVPDVREDLARRDLTINAMAYNEKEGLVDPFGGQADLQSGIVRAVGVPRQRFTEDALRILRLYRFAARFGFAIDPPTAQAAQELCAHLDCVSVERIEEELAKLLSAPAPAAYLNEKILSVVLPELSPEALAAAKPVVDACPAGAENLPVRLAALLLSLGEDGIRRTLKRLRCSNALIEEAAVLVREARGCDGSFLFGHDSGHSIARPIAFGNRVPPQRTVLRETTDAQTNTTAPRWSALLCALLLRAGLQAFQLALPRFVTRVQSAESRHFGVLALERDGVVVGRDDLPRRGGRAQHHTAAYAGTLFPQQQIGDGPFAHAVELIGFVKMFHRMAGDFRVKSVRMNVCKHDPVRRLIQGKRPAFFRGRDS